MSKAERIQRCAAGITAEVRNVPQLPPEPMPRPDWYLVIAYRQGQGWIIPSMLPRMGYTMREMALEDVRRHLTGSAWKKIRVVKIPGEG